MTIDRVTGTPERARRGFATMTAERRQQIASMGGRAVHRVGHAHEFTSAEGRAAALKRIQRIAPPDQ